MANFSVVKRASSMLFTQTKSIILQKRNVAAQVTTSQFVEISHNDDNGITTLSLSRPPVNSFSLEFLQEIRKALQDAVENKSKGIIFTSSLPTVFSAGLDIREMCKPDIQRCNKFWTALQDMWLTLYGLPIPTAAAINGASPAAGCLLSMSCEYRVMVKGEHTIGLNETVLGILVPKWIENTMVRTIGRRQAELALLRGSLFKPDEALNIGLLDELASDKDDALDKCEKYISEYAKMSSQARAATKLNLRKSAIKWLEKNRDLDRTTFLDFLLLPKTQERVDNYLQSLKKKSK